MSRITSYCRDGRGFHSLMWGPFPNEESAWEFALVVDEIVEQQWGDLIDDLGSVVPKPGKVWDGTYCVHLYWEGDQCPLAGEVADLVDLKKGASHGTNDPLC